MDTGKTYADTFTADGTFDVPWRPAPALPSPLRGHAAVSDREQIFVVGGSAVDQDFSSKVFSARLGTQGMEAWREEEPLPRPLAYHTASTGSGWLMVTGGQGPDDSNVVYGARLEAGAAPGHWQTAGLLPGAMRGHGAFIADGRLFVLGGHNQEAYFAAVRSAAIDPEGKVEGWREETPLPVPLVHFAVVVHGDQVLVLGGQDEQAFLSDRVWSAELQGGRLGAWKTLRPLPIENARLTGTVLGGSLLLTGGGYGFMPPVHDEIWRVEFSPEGELGAWKLVGRLPRPLAFHMVIVVEK
jgi:N-acetylneuraminic acid mutarotase